MKFRERYTGILENFQRTSILKKQRLFFPRNFEISPEFEKAFQKEFNRLKDIYKLSNGDILRKINKALLWLIR
jgi:hypothetical protein